MKFDEIKDNTLDELEGQILTDEESEFRQKVKTQKLTGLNKNDSISPGWDNLLNDSVTYTTLSNPKYKVLAVDRIWQRRSGIKNQGSACGPTVGAMIADYYHDNMNYNVRDNAYYGSWAKLTNHLYPEMNTGSLGTSLTNWRFGMLMHVRHDVSSSAWTSYQYQGVGNSSKFINAINSNDPVAIRFGLFNREGLNITWHFVTGVGYQKDVTHTGGLQVAYLNPDGGQNNNSRHWMSWTANDNDFSFAYMK